MNEYSLDDLLGYLNLRDPHASLGHVTKVLNTLEKRGYLDAYNRLFRNFITRYDDIITPEMFFHAYEHHLVRLAKTDAKDIAELFVKNGYSNTEMLGYFKKHEDVEMYTALVERLLEGDSSAKGLDKEVLKGHINMNSLTVANRARIIKAAENPQKVFEKMTPLKQQDTAGFMVSNLRGVTEKAIPVIFHYYKEYLRALIERGRYTPFADSIGTIFNAIPFVSFVSELCEILQVAYEKWKCQHQHPFTSPRILSVCGTEDEKHLGVYDFVSQPDAWHQRIVRQNGRFGLIDERGNVILPPKFKSIGGPSHRGRVVLGYASKPLFVDRDGNPKDH